MLSLWIRRVQRFGFRPGSIRSCSTVLNPPNDSIPLLIKLLDMSSEAEIIQKIGPLEKIRYINGDDIQNSYDQLRSLNIEPKEIRESPKVILTNTVTIFNRYHVLRETGIPKVRIDNINHYVSIVNQSVEKLKDINLIPKHKKVAQHLGGFLMLDLGNLQFNDSEQLKALRVRIINEYLFRYFDVPEHERERIWKVYPNLRHKSLQAIYTAVELLQSELCMSKERIIKHPYLLYADPENVRKIIAEPTLGGINTKELMWRRPKILMSTHSALMKVQQHLRTFEIPDTSVPLCIEMFTLSPHTVYERLKEIKEDKDFSVHAKHPRILRLLHYHSKATARRDYLQKMKVNCVSLHILSSCSTHFERYTRTGLDRTNGGDIVQYLSKMLNQSANMIRRTLKRHPNWNNVPAPEVKKTFEFLVEQGYSLSCIQDNIYLTVYPMKRIETQLQALKTSDGTFDVNFADMTENQQLQMCLYLIEREFHFAGDGIWLHPLQTSDCGECVVPETEAQMLGNYKAKTVRPKKRLGKDVAKVNAPEACAA